MAKRKAKSNPGKGAFKRCVKAVKKRGGAVDAKAVCAASLRKSMGAKELAKTAAKGRKNPATEYFHSTKKVQAERRVEQLKRQGYDVSLKFINGQWAVYSGAKAKNPPTLIKTMRQGQLSADVYRVGKGKFEAELDSGEKQSFDSFGGAMGWARVMLHDKAKNPSAPVNVFTATGASVIDTVSRIGRGLKRKGGKLLKKVRKNPVGEATQAYEDFHGLPSDEIVEILTEEHVHSTTWGVGKLVCLCVIGLDGKPLPELVSCGFTYEGKKGDVWAPEREMSKNSHGWVFDPKTPREDIVMLTAAEKGNQLFLVGGDQSLPLKSLGLEEQKRDHMLIGTIVRVWYRTRKSFESNGEEVDFFHDFGRGEKERGPVHLTECPSLAYNPLNPSMQILGGVYRIAKPRSDIGASPGIVA